MSSDRDDSIMNGPAQWVNDNGAHDPADAPHATYVEFPAAPHIQLANYNPTKRPDTSCVAALPPFDFTP